MKKLNYDRVFNKLLALLPKKHIILMSSNCHNNENDFINLLNQVDMSTDAVIIDDEMWPRPNFESILVEHPNLQDKDVIIVTLRYENRRISNRVFLVSYPSFFLGGRYYKNQEIPIKQKNLEFGFSCLNRRPAFHRMLLGYQLHKNNLLDKIIFSLGNEGYINHTCLADKIPNLDEFLNLLPINSAHSWNDHTITHPAYSNAYCNIVTETETETVPYKERAYDLEIITEKSYKPFMAKQIPLFLASKRHLEYLKNLGFEVMEDLLPPGYDLANTEEKISAIIKIVATGKEYIEDFYFSHIPELEHNYQLISSDKVENLLLENIKNLFNNTDIQ